MWLLKRAQILVGDIWGAFQVIPAPTLNMNTSRGFPASVDIFRPARET